MRKLKLTVAARLTPDAQVVSSKVRYQLKSPCIRATVMLSLLALKIIKQSVFYPGPSVVHVVSMNDHTPEEDLWMFCFVQWSKIPHAANTRGCWMVVLAIS